MSVVNKNTAIKKMCGEMNLVLDDFKKFVNVLGAKDNADEEDMKKVQYFNATIGTLLNLILSEQNSEYAFTNIIKKHREDFKNSV